VHSAEVVDTREPQAEELVCPSIALKHMQCQSRVVVDGVDDDFHQVDLEGFDLRLFVGEDLHGQCDEFWNVVIDVSTHVEHDDLGELATADAVDTSHLVILEDGSHHIHDGIEVWAVLNQGLSSVVDEVFESR